MKRSLVTLALGAAILMLVHTSPVVAHKNGVGSARLNLVEATVEDLQKAIQTGLITITQLTDMYLARVNAYDDAGPGVNAFLHVNANAVSDASELDALRHPGIAPSPLYGIPVLLKDNIDTADMPTTAGSVALAGSIAPDDAFISQKLRAAGAIIIGKATLTEFANSLRLRCRPATARSACLVSIPMILARCPAATAGLCCRLAARVRGRASR